MEPPLIGITSPRREVQGARKTSASEIQMNTTSPTPLRVLREYVAGREFQLPKVAKLAL